MQITQTTPQTLMMFPSVSQGAHQALVDKSPEKAVTETPKAVESPQRSAAHPANSIDILI